MQTSQKRKDIEITEENTDAETLQQLADKGWRYLILAPVRETSFPLPSDEVIKYGGIECKIEKKEIKEERVMNLEPHNSYIVNIQRDLVELGKKDQSRP
ncbi:hypothetical protein ACFLZ7_03900 [Nanoarchaeota archaeon]